MRRFFLILIFTSFTSVIWAAPVNVIFSFYGLKPSASYYAKISMTTDDVAYQFIKNPVLSDSSGSAFGFFSFPWDSDIPTDISVQLYQNGYSSLKANVWFDQVYCSTNYSDVVLCNGVYVTVQVSSVVPPDTVSSGFLSSLQSSSVSLRDAFVWLARELSVFIGVLLFRFVSLRSIL